MRSKRECVRNDGAQQQHHTAEKQQRVVFRCDEVIQNNSDDDGEPDPDRKRYSQPRDFDRSR